MKCIIVNEDITTREVFQKLIKQNENLTGNGCFNDVYEASKFMSENEIDVIFIDIYTEENESIRFIKTIPDNVFVIFISEFSSSLVKTHNFDVTSHLSERFEKGVNQAQIYFGLLKKNKSNNIDDYFVI